MKISMLLRTAMINNGLHTAEGLARLSGVNVTTVRRALDGKNVGINSVLIMIDRMGYQLSISLKGDS